MRIPKSYNSRTFQCSHYVKSNVLDITQLLFTKKLKIYNCNNKILVLFNTESNSTSVFLGLVFIQILNEAYLKHYECFVYSMYTLYWWYMDVYWDTAFLDSILFFKYFKNIEREHLSTSSLHSLLP